MHDKLVDLTNMRFGKLTVLELYTGNSNNRTYWKCRCDCGKEIVVDADKLKRGQQSCDCTDISHNGSKNEIEIKEYIKTIFTEEPIKDKSVLSGKEIDLYYQNKHIGIEYNGSIYHCSLGGIFGDKDKYYHRDKFLLAKEKGIHLITIFDVDWDRNKDKIKMYLRSLFSKNIKLYARKCIISIIDNNTANNFIARYHIQGSNKSLCKINLGLFYNDELVSVMSFGRKRLSKTENGEYELHRYCVKDNYTIIGGANKLLKYFEYIYKPISLLSYSDNDYFIGNIYERLGFTNLGQSTPRYYWYKNNIEYKREKCRLNNLKIHYPELLKEAYDNNASNKEDYVMSKLGAVKVYRCGNTKWLKLYK